MIYISPVSGLHYIVCFFTLWTRKHKTEVVHVLSNNILNGRRKLSSTSFLKARGMSLILLESGSWNWNNPGKFINVVVGNICFTLVLSSTKLIVSQDNISLIIFSITTSADTFSRVNCFQSLWRNVLVVCCIAPYFPEILLIFYYH